MNGITRKDLTDYLFQTFWVFLFLGATEVIGRVSGLNDYTGTSDGNLPALVILALIVTAVMKAFDRNGSRRRRLLELLAQNSSTKLVKSLVVDTLGLAAILLVLDLIVGLFGGNWIEVGGIRAIAYALSHAFVITLGINLIDSLRNYSHSKRLLTN